MALAFYGICPFAARYGFVMFYSTGPWPYSQVMDAAKSLVRERPTNTLAYLSELLVMKKIILITLTPGV